VLASEHTRIKGNLMTRNLTYFMIVLSLSITAISIVGLTVKYKKEVALIEAGLQQCMEYTPGDSIRIIWKKECDSNKKEGILK